MPVYIRVCVRYVLRFSLEHFNAFNKSYFLAKVSFLQSETDK